MINIALGDKEAIVQHRNSPDGLAIRFPPGMRDFVKAEAARNDRSMNAEIVHQLKRAYRFMGAAGLGCESQDSPAASSTNTGLASGVSTNG